MTRTEASASAAKRAGLTRTDLIDGFRHAIFLDGRLLGAFAAYQAMLALVTVIAGGPIWAVLALLGLAVVPVVRAVITRTRGVHEARELYHWLREQGFHADAD